jgi:ATP-independent RNA helicase DbpA
MSRAHQKNPVQVKIEESEKTAPSIRQVVYEVDASQKLTGLLWLIQQTQPESAIVFCNLKAHVMDLVKVLVDAGVCSAGLHGDLEQVERDRVMAKFRNGSTRILVATDVAARGLDVENLDAVYNFDLPLQPEIYVHRIGRTGRAGKKGSALALATPRQKSIVENIEKYTGKKIEEKTFPDLSHLGNDHFKKTLQQDAAMVTLYVSGGRKEKMRPGDLLGALTGEAGGLAGTDVGKIEIHDHFSYVAISKAVAATALQRMRMGRIKGRHFRVEYVR